MNTLAHFSRLVAPLLLCLGLGISSGDVSAQKTYRWVDEHGQVHYTDQPPPPTAKKAEVKNYAPSGADSTPGFATRKAAENFPVVLYSSDNCGDLCTSARELLQKRGIPFSERKVSTQEDFTAYRALFGTPEEVPAVTIGRLTRKGFESEAWNRILDDAGYPRMAPPGSAAPAPTPAPAAPVPAAPAPTAPAPAAPAAE